MAHGVGASNSITIQQALHGYAEGHQQLALTVAVQPRDANMLLVLSDVSGLGSQVQDSGYITGYPLADSKLYAFARTWPAPEMPRPGCVWTHTLLIDFADLARLADPARLLALLRRPDPDGLAAYRVSLEIAAHGSASPLEDEASAYARRLLATLYRRPRERLVAARESSVDVDRVLVAIWAQQWPRLRRTFRFCSFAVADRSGDAGTFDLQLLPERDRSARTRFPDAADVMEWGKPEPWLEDAVADLVQPDAEGLRTFLRQAGSDVSSGREAFSTLCSLHSHVRLVQRGLGALEPACALLEADLGLSQARAARGILATAALNQSDTLSPTALDFVVRNLDVIELGAMESNSGKLGRELWKHDPASFLDMFEGSEQRRAVVLKAIEELSTRELVDGLRRAPSLAAFVCARRPEVVTEPDFWGLKDVRVALTSTALASSPELRARAAVAAMRALSGDLAGEVVRELGAASVLRALATQLRTSPGRLEALAPWIAAAVKEPADVASVLSEPGQTSWPFLCAIAVRVGPDAVPNEFGTDPWLLSAQAANKNEPRGMPQLLSAYLLSRALGVRSRNAAELMQLSFEGVYEAAAGDQLSDQAWAVLSERLPWAVDWLGWDRCLRLREAVGSTFVERGLSVEVFSRIVFDDGLFEELAISVAHSRAGRRFLKQARTWMKGHDATRLANRIRIVERVVGREY